MASKGTGRSQAAGRTAARNRAEAGEKPAWDFGRSAGGEGSGDSEKQKGAVPGSIAPATARALSRSRAAKARSASGIPGGGRRNGSRKGTAATSDAGGRGQAGKRGGEKDKDRRQPEMSDARQKSSKSSGGWRAVGSAAGSRALAVGSKAVGTVKEHPYTTAATAAATAAGLGLLLARGMRRGRRSGAPDSDAARKERSDDRAAGERREQDNEAGGANGQGRDSGGSFRGRVSEGMTLLGRLGRDGLSTVGSALRGGADAVGRGARDGADALGRHARSGFVQGRETGERVWENYPLLIALGTLAVGATVGMLLPSTAAEDSLVGTASDKLTGRAKKAGQELWDQGRSVAGRVVQQAVETTTREIELEGLSPARLGKKVKRVASQVRDAVASAVQED